jgi:hypothetical protein
MEALDVMSKGDCAIVGNRTADTFASHSLPDVLVIVGGWITVLFLVAYIESGSGNSPSPDSTTNTSRSKCRGSCCDIDTCQLLWAATVTMSAVVLDGLVHASELAGSCNRNMTIDSFLSSSVVFYIAHRYLTPWFVATATGFDCQVATVSLITALMTPILHAMSDGLRYHIVGYFVVGRTFGSVSQRFVLLAISAEFLSRLFNADRLQTTAKSTHYIPPQTDSVRPSAKATDPTPDITNHSGERRPDVMTT